MPVATRAPSRGRPRACPARRHCRLPGTHEGYPYDRRCRPSQRRGRPRACPGAESAGPDRFRRRRSPLLAGERRVHSAVVQFRPEELLEGLRTAKVLEYVQHGLLTFRSGHTCRLGHGTCDPIFFLTKTFDIEAIREARIVLAVYLGGNRSGLACLVRYHQRDGKSRGWGFGKGRGWGLGARERQLATGH